MRIFKKTAVSMTAFCLLALGALGAVVGVGGPALAATGPDGLITGCEVQVNAVENGFEPNCEAIGGSITVDQRSLIDAGFQPNQWTERLDSEAVLTGIIGAVRHYGRMPTKDELSLYRSTEPNVPSDQAIRRHFGGYSGLVAALAMRSDGKAMRLVTQPFDEIQHGVARRQLERWPVRHMEGFVAGVALRSLGDGDEWNLKTERG